MWINGGVTWQSKGAVSVLDAGAAGDGVTDDWAAIQGCVDKHEICVLPQGFYRVSRPVVLRKAGVSLVGVGRTISFIMPISEPKRGSPFLGGSERGALPQPVLARSDLYLSRILQCLG